MANVITIDLTVKMGSFNTNMRQAGRQIATLNNGSSQIGAGFQKATKQVGVFSNAIRQNQALMKAYGSGNPVSIADAQFASFKAQRAASRAVQQMQGGGSSFGSRISKAAASGSGMGAAAAMLGPEVLAATAAIELLKNAAESSAASIKKFQNAAYGMPGSTPDQAASANQQEKYSGVGPADWTGIDANMRGGGSPIARSRIINRIPGFKTGPAGPIGAGHSAETADAIIRYMMSKQISDAEKIQTAADIGDNRILKYKDLSEQDYQLLKKSGFKTDLKSQSHRDAQDALADNGFEIAKDFVWRNSPLYMMKRLVGSVASAWSGGNAGNTAWSGAIGGGQAGPAQAKASANKTDDLINAITENTRAHRENILDIKKHNGEGIGGGRNAANMPTAAWVHHLVADEAARTAIQLGAYRL